jgi:Ca2+-binding RTX toxin-like protein
VLAAAGSYTINGGPAVVFSGVTRLAVSGGDGNDTLTIVNPDGSLFAPTDGISYDGGGQPADTLEVLAGTATDFIYTADQVNEATGEGSDTVYATTHFRLSANVENLVLQGSADLQGYGNSLANGLYGNAGNNILDGDAAADDHGRRGRQ